MITLNTKLLYKLFYSKEMYQLFILITYINYNYFVLLIALVFNSEK